MSRLDRHVSAVRNRLALALFIDALAWTCLGVGTVLLLMVLADQLFLLYPPRPAWWIAGGAAAAVVAALAYAVRFRPDPKQAAVAIDQKLGLNEKISTALYLRPSEDPFAKASVRDAEQAAESLVVNYRKHFPSRFPRPAYAAIGVVVLALCAWRFIDPMDLFDRRERHAQQVRQQQKLESARKTVERALASVEAIPRTPGAEEAIKLAKSQLAATLREPIVDPAKANRTAVKALQDVNDAIKQQIKESGKYAQAQNDQKMLNALQPPAPTESGPVADAQRSLAKGEFTQAIDELTKAVDNFDKLDKQEQKKAAQQMQQMAQQLQQMANANPQQQQQVQQQLQQQLGMNQQQAKQAQQLMQQAAQGDKQAQQQLQQMSRQAMQQANNGQGLNPQQQQMLNQVMQQMQAQANAQQTAQQMAQAAQQMAQAMQQAQQGQQGQQGQQSQQGQQGGQQAQQQRMQQAAQQMQQQLGQMQAAAQDAQQVAAAQAAAQAAQNVAQNAAAGNQPNGNGKQPGQGQGQGQWNGGGDGQIAGDPKQQGQWAGQPGQAGPNQGGIGAGDRNYKQQAPFAVKPEIDPSQEDEKGRILASTFIKDSKPIKGQSTESLKAVAQAAVQEQADEIDQERIGRQAQNAVKKYFGSIQDESPASSAPPPATPPSAPEK